VILPLFLFSLLVVLEIENADGFLDPKGLRHAYYLRTHEFDFCLNFLLFQAGLWIRIRIGSRFSDFVDPDPYPRSGSRGKKIKKFQWKNALFSYFLKNLPLKRYKTPFEKKI
jgi:hypothetical protein